MPRRPARPAFRPALTHLEDRSTPANTSFAAGVLSIDFTAASEAVTLTNSAGGVTLTGTTFTGAGGGVFSGVTRLVVTDGSNSAGQTLTVAGTALTLPGGLTSTGVETNTFNAAVETSTADLSVTANRNIAVRAALSGTNVTLDADTGSQVAGNFAGVDITANVTATAILTVEGRGGDSAHNNEGVRLSGAVVQGGAGAGVTTRVMGTGGAAGGSSNVGVELVNFGSQITSGGGAVVVAGTGGGTGVASSSNHGVYVSHYGRIAAGGSGAVNVTGRGGMAGGGRNNYGVYVFATNAHITSGGGAVTVDGTGGGTGAGSASNIGVIAQVGGQITAGGAGALNVTGRGSTAAAGSDNYGVYVGDTGSRIASGGGAVRVDGTGGAGANNVAVVVIGNGVVASGGDAAVTVTADRVTIDATGSVNAGTGTVTIRPRTAGTQIDLGTETAGRLSLTDVELDRVTAGTLVIGDGTAGSITVSAAVSPANVPTLSLVTGGGVSQAAGAGLTATALAVRSVGVATLDQANAVDTLAASVTGAGSAFTYTGSGDTTVGTVDGVSGLTANGGDIAVTLDASTLTVANDVASAAGNITLTTARNIGVNYGVSLNTTSGDISLSANQQATATSGLFVGVSLGGSVTTATGDISLAGRGGDDPMGGQIGISFSHVATVGSTGSGSVTVTGTGGAGSGPSNIGVWLVGFAARITSGGGPVTVHGTGGGTGPNSGYNRGVLVADGAQVTAGGSGAVRVTGRGQGGDLAPNDGVLVVNGGLITSGGGEVTVEGSGDGVGVVLFSGAQGIGSITSGGNAPVTLTTDSLAIDATSSVSAGSGTVTIRTRTAGRAIDLGSATDTAAALELSDAELDRVTAGTLVIGRQDLATGAVTVSAPLTLTPADVRILSGRNIAVNAALSGANVTLDADTGSQVAGNFVGVDIAANVTATGTLTVDGRGGDTGNNNSGVRVRDGAEVQGGAGTGVTTRVTGLGGASTWNFNPGLYVTGGGSRITSGGGAVAVDGNGGGTGVGSGFNHGVFVEVRGLITAGGSGAVAVTGRGGSTAGGRNNYGVSVSGFNALITSSGGAVVVDGTGGGTGSVSTTNIGVIAHFSGQITAGGSGAVSITARGSTATASSDNYGLYVGGTGSRIASGGAVTVDGTGGAGANGVAVVVVGNGQVASGGNAAVSVTADSVTIDGTGSMDAGTGTVTIRSRTAGTQIDLGGADVFTPGTLTLGLTDAELDRVTAGTLVIGDGTAGSITVSEAVSPANAGTLSLITGGGVSQAAGAGLTATRLAVRSVGAAVLDRANAVGTLAAAVTGGGSAFTYAGTGATAVRVVNGVSGLTTNGGNIAVTLDASQLTVANAVSAGAGNVTLASGRNIAVTAAVSGADVTLDADTGSQVAGSFVGVDIAAGVIATGTLTVEGRGGDTGLSNSGVRVRGGAAVQGGAGAGVTTRVTGLGGVSSGTSNSGLHVTGGGSRITSVGGAVTVDGTGGGTGAGSRSNHGVFVELGGLITAGGAGAVGVTGRGGSTAGGGNNHGVWVVNSGSRIASGGGAVTVDGTGGGTGGGSISNIGVIAQNRGQITAGGSGTLAVTGRGSTATASSDNYGVYVGDAASRIASGGGAVTINGSGGAGSNGVAVVVIGNGQVASGGNAAVSVTADSVTIDGTGSMDAGTGTVTIRSRTAGTQIDLGGADVFTPGTLTLGLTDAELDRVTAGTLVIGDATAGNITVSADLSRPTATDLQLVSGSDITVSGGSIDTAGGTLRFAPGGGVSFPKAGTDATATATTFATGSRLAVAVSGIAPDTGFGPLVVSGPVDLTGVTLELSGSYVPAAGESFVVVSGTSVVGTFDGLPDGSILTFNGVDLHVLYTADAVTLVANRAPVGVTAGGPYAIREGDGLTVSATATDPDGDPLTYTWDVNGDGVFGDEAFGTATDGGWKVTFTPSQLVPLGLADGSSSTPALAVRVSDGLSGGSVTVTTTLTVSDVAPMVAVSGSGVAVEGVEYTVTLGAVTDPGPDAVALYRVNWGDGTSTVYATGGDVTHVYADDGVYTVTVDLTDEDGTVLNAGTPHTVTVANVAPKITSLSVPTNAVGGRQISLSATASDSAGPLDPLTFTWVVTRNGVVAATDSRADFTFTPAAGGTHVVTLTVSDGDGGTTTATRTVEVTPPAQVVSAVGSVVKLTNPITLTTTELTPFPGFRGGVSVASADLNGDGVLDTVVGAGPGGGPHVRAFDGTNGRELASFFAFDPSFRGGVNVSAVNGRIVLGAGPGGGPHVKVLDAVRAGEVLANGQIADSALAASFYAYDPAFRGGVTVAAADLNGDGEPDVVTGAGAGGAPHVKAIDGRSLGQVQASGQIADSALLANFFAFDPSVTGGVNVAAGGGRIAVGAGAGNGPHVQVFDTVGNAQESFFAYDPAFTGGVRVGFADANADGVLDLLTAAGPGGGPHVKAFALAPLLEIQSVFAADATDPRGVFVN